MSARAKHGFFVAHLILVNIEAVVLLFTTFGLFVALAGKLTGIQLIIVTLPGGNNAFVLLAAFLLSLVLTLILGDNAHELRNIYDERYPIRYP